MSGLGREDCEAALRARGVLPVQVQGLIACGSRVLFAAVAAETLHEHGGIDCHEQPEGIECVLLLDSVRAPVGLFKSFADLDGLRGE